MQIPLCKMQTSYGNYLEKWNIHSQCLKDFQPGGLNTLSQLVAMLLLLPTTFLPSALENTITIKPPQNLHNKVEEEEKEEQEEDSS